MKKSDWQYLVDTLLFVCMVGIAFIGILLGFILAEGPTVRESEKYFMGLHRHQWGDIHLYLSLAFIGLVILHLALSWSWIKGKAQALFKKSWHRAIALTVLGACLLIFVFWVFTPKYSLVYENYGRGAGARSRNGFMPEDFIDRSEGYVIITGNMTISEVEQLTGIPGDTLIRELGLPTNTSPDETLGQLRKKYGFTLVQARDAVTAILRQDERASKRTQVNEKLPHLNTETSPARRSIDETPREHEEEPKLTRGRLEEDQSGILITGRMTLFDIEKETGIGAREITDTLGLPHNTSLDMSLGRLRRRYGFTMQEVREVIASLIDKKGE